MKAGTISIDLTLDSRLFSIRAMEAGKVLKEMQSDFKRTSDATVGLDQHFNSFSTKLRHFAVTVASIKYTMRDFGEVFLGPMAAIVKAGGEMERMTLLMKGLSKAASDSGKTEDAAKGLKYIIDLSKTAPFNIKTLTDSFVKFKAGGLDPMNGSMNALVDSVARYGGTSEQMHRASIAIQQMSGKGVISMEELRQQLGEAVPNAIQLMATGVGMGMGEFVAAVSKGTVEATSALDRMFTMMRIENDGAAANMMNSWVGLTQRLATEWELFKVSIAQTSYMDEAKRAVTGFVDSFKASEVRQFAADIGRGLADVVTSMVEFVRFVRENSAEIKVVAEGLLTIWAFTKIHAGLTAVTVAYKAFTSTTVAGFATMTASAATHEATRSTLLAKAAIEQKLYEQSYRAEVLLRADLEALAARADIAMTARRIAIKHQEIAAQVAVTASARASTAAYLAQAEAAGVAAASTTTLSRVMAVLGGPIGIITALLTAGILAWQNWGDSAQEAGRKAKKALADAKKGIADQAGLDETDKQISGAKKDLKAHQDLKGSQYGTSPEAYDAKTKELTARIAAFQETRTAQLIAIEKNGVNDAVEGHRHAIDSELTRMKGLDSVKYEAKRSAYEAELKELGKNEAAKKALTKAHTAEISRDAVEATQQQLDYINRNAANAVAAQKKARESGNKQNEAAATLALQKLQADRKGMEAQMEQAKKLGSVDLVNAKASARVKNFNSPNDNPLIRALEDSKAKLEVSKLKMAQLLRGAREVSDIQAEVEAQVRGEVESGRLSFKKDKHGAAIKPSMNSAEVQDIIKKRVEAQANIETNKALTDANDKVRETAVNASEAMDRLHSGGKEKSTSAMIQLRKHFDDIEKTLAKTNDALEKFNALRNQAFAQQASADLADLSSSQGEKIKDINNSLIRNPKDREQADYERRVKEMKDSSDLRINSLITAGSAPGVSGDAAEEASRQVIAAEERKNATLEAMAAEHARKMETPMEAMLADWSDTTKAMQDRSADWLNSGTEMLISYAKTGKLEFGKFAESVISDLIRIQMRKAMSGMFSATEGAGLASMFGFADGGIMSSMGSLPLRKYANGGIANRPQLAVFGEGRMNEAYVPLPDGRSIPVTMSGTQGGNMIVNVNVVEGEGTKANVSQKQNSDGSLSIDVIIEQVEGAISGNVARGRGSLSSTMEKTYGLNRAAGNY